MSDGGFGPRRVDGVSRSDREEHMAVRRRSGDEFGADIAAGTRPVLDDLSFGAPAFSDGNTLRHPPVVRSAIGAS
jgi:hypothetical protein